MFETPYQLILKLNIVIFSERLQFFHSGNEFVKSVIETDGNGDDLSIDSKVDIVHKFDSKNTFLFLFVNLVLFVNLYLTILKEDKNK